MSRYLGEDTDRRHVRFSVWDEGGGYARAEAAVSLDEDEDEDEAARLAAFLSDAPTLVTEPRAGNTSR